MQPDINALTRIRSTLVEVGHLAVDVTALQDTDDLYDAGLTSLNTVNLMLAIEDCFDCEFPEEMLNRDTFHSIASIGEAVERLINHR